MRQTANTESPNSSVRYVRSTTRVNILRLRHGIKVDESEFQETDGAPQIYGKQYYLIEESGWKQYRRKAKTSRKYLTRNL